MKSDTDVQTGGADEAVVEVATTESPEVRVVTEVLDKEGSEIVPLVQRFHDSAVIQGAFSLPEAEDESVVDVELADATQRQLSPEDAERILSTLESRFKTNDHLHEGCDWSKVKTALEASPEALWSVNQMEAQGHMPDVYNFDDSGFDIGTCSEETPAGARNCVYDAEAAAWLKENYPDEKFNGSAVELADAMGISLMSEAQYKEVLQRKGKFGSRTTWSWLLTDRATREAGDALYGYRFGDDVYVGQWVAYRHDPVGAFRGSLRVLWT